MCPQFCPQCIRFASGDLRQSQMDSDGFQFISEERGAHIAYLSVGNYQRRRIELSTVLRIFQSDAD